jgi:bifunctional non-homologous end joining protein LigD
LAVRNQIRRIQGARSHRAGKCRLISRRGNDFKSFPALTEALLAELKLKSVVLDGEIVCLNDEGKTELHDLLFRRGEPCFVAFDLLWHDGQDFRYSPLTERKHKTALNSAEG